MQHHHTNLTAPGSRTRALSLAAFVPMVALALAGCASSPSLTGDDHPEQPLTHVHGIVDDPATDGFLIGTHEGIFTVTRDGELGARLAKTDFDAMGLTVLDDTLVASGHPGRTTPPELGAPNLGIIRSSDNGQSWQPTAFTGEKDFHALAADPRGTLYGVATDANEMLTSTDGGVSWQPTGAPVYAMSLAVDAAGRVMASTADGLLVSTDRAATFQAWPDAPLLAGLSASPDHNRVVGIGTQGRIWATTAGAQNWFEVGTTHGTAQAVTITNNGDILVVDDSGLSLIPYQQ